MLAGSSAVNRESTAAAISQATWLYGNDGSELATQLATLGLIVAEAQQPEIKS